MKYPQSRQEVEELLGYYEAQPYKFKEDFTCEEIGMESKSELPHKGLFYTLIGIGLFYVLIVVCLLIGIGAAIGYGLR